ncbi:MAG TPA: hypothetical protein VEL31_17970 [Ktedonobacteraceae bacterium]|nr:hypothetical protein [Ktedonobacteraceae bacterium]
MWGRKKRRAQPKSEHPNTYTPVRPAQPQRGQRPFTPSDYSYKGQQPRKRQCSWCFKGTSSTSVVCSNCGWNEYTRCHG